MVFIIHDNLEPTYIECEYPVKYSVQSSFAVKSSITRIESSMPFDHEKLQATFSRSSGVPVCIRAPSAVKYPGLQPGITTYP